MIHDKSFERLQSGAMKDYSELFESLADQAEKLNAAHSEMTHCWLDSEDSDCAGMYAPELVFRVRMIGSSD